MLLSETMVRDVRSNAEADRPTGTAERQRISRMLKGSFLIANGRKLRCHYRPVVTCVIIAASLVDFEQATASRPACSS